jgi:hypothetical protein
MWQLLRTDIATNGGVVKLKHLCYQFGYRQSYLRGYRQNYWGREKRQDFQIIGVIGNL